MRRLIAPCACALALITGAWVGQAYPLLTPLDPIGEENTTPLLVADTVWKFYDAIDLLLRTGDAGALREIIAPDFVDHVDTPGSLANRDGLLGYLASLRTTVPDLRLVPEEVSAQADRAIAAITLSGDDERAIMGIPLAGPPPWPEAEIVRIADGQIAERWGGPAGYASSTLVFSEAMAVPSRGAVLPYLRRITVPPGVNDAALDRLDPAIVVVESGELAVGTVDGGSGAAPAAYQTLGPGSTLVIPESMDVELSNRSDAPAVFLLLSLAQPNQAPRPGMDTNLMDAIDGIEVRTLAGHGTVEALISTVGLTAKLAEVTLAPGMRLSTHEVGVTEFVVVDVGTLTAAFTGEAVKALVRDAEEHRTVPDSDAEVFQGFGLSVSGEGASISYGNESSTRSGSCS